MATIVLPAFSGRLARRAATAAAAPLEMPEGMPTSAVRPIERELSPNQRGIGKLFS